MSSNVTTPQPPLARNKAPIKKNVPKLPPSHRDFFRLRYFKFKFRDYLRTIDFYKTCGMVVDFEGSLESLPCMPFNLQTKNPATMESQHVKKVETVKEDSIINADSAQANIGGSCGRCVGFSYSVPAGSSNRDAYINRIQLIFQEDLDYAHEQITNKMKKDQNMQENDVLKDDDDEHKDKNTVPDNKREYEYIVIYVHFIDRLIKRLDTKGFQILLNTTDIEGVKLAIVIDPNGLQIRFLEMSDNHLSQNKSEQWYARFGYYIVESKDADGSVALYEQLFQARLKKEPGTTQAKAKEEVEAKVNLRKVGAAQTVKTALSKGPGFRLVDMDEFVVGLVNTVFYWLGNDMRGSAPCLCFTEVSNADTGVAITEHIPSKSPLVAIGFEVGNVDATIVKLKYEMRDELEWAPLRYKMAKAGIAARFSDKINNCFLEIFSSKPDAPILQGKLGRNKPVAKDIKGTDQKDQSEYRINLDHLKRTARTLSEGAIYRTRGFGSDLQKSQVPQPPVEDIGMKKKFDRKLNSFMPDNSSNPKSKREARDFAIDLFLLRTKGKSI